MNTYNYIVDILNPYFLTFLIGTTLYSICSNALDWMNSNKGDIRGKLKELHKIHPLMKKYFTFGKVSKANSYNVECENFSDFTESTRHGFSVIFLLLGLAPFLLHTTFELFPNLGTGWCYVIFATSMSLLKTVLDIPFEYYGNFVLEAKYGFNKMTKGVFVADEIKSFVMNSIIGGTLILSVNFLLGKIGRITFNAIPYVLAATLLYQFTMEFLSIHVFMRMFNKFEPLKDRKLLGKMKTLFSRFGYDASKILVMDGSRRSSHSNAFICGFGKHKKIVLFDTLLKNYTHDELVAILGHELAHGKLNHILKGRILSFIEMTVVTALTVTMMYDVSLYHAFGFNWVTEANVLDYQMVGIVLSGMIIGSFMWMKTPFESAISRKHEYEADSMSVKITNKKSAMVSSLIKLNSENLSDVFPNGAYEYWHYSHPSLVNRISTILGKKKNKNKKNDKVKKTVKAKKKTVGKGK